ncbi:MAG: Hsp33 family molecular chaperone HslO [Limnobacter sp.]|nr:Hsp33 family molecular chaperone HslO [Limnobacter sp.]
MTDNLRTLLFDQAACRAQIVRLDKAWKTVVSHHNYPQPVLEILGHLVAASALLSASLKFEGSLILQIQGDGPVRLMVAECTNELHVRATVKLAEDSLIAPDADFTSLLNGTGKGLCALILDPKNRLPGQQAYQGVVPLEGKNIAESLQAYMKSSEQLDTRLHLFANEETVSGVLIQQMPKDGGHAPENFDADGWDRLIALSATTTAEEMLKLPMADMCYRLFTDMSPNILAERTVEFQCTCSRKKVARMLLGLGQTEVDATLQEHPHITVHCDFCNSAYVFTEKQCQELFSNDQDLDPPDEELPEDANVVADLSREGKPPTLH